MSNQYRVAFFFDKCVYKDCTSERLLCGKRLFRFPLQTDVRHKLWIRNSGKKFYINIYNITHLAFCAISYFVLAEWKE